MTGTPFVGLYPFQWIALLVAAVTLLLLADALAGHYRSGFAFRAQYAPFASGGLLIIAAVAASISPDAWWTNKALRVAGWLAVITGAAGFGFHHYYGVARKPGGYKWLLHYLMYGAPQLAPLGLAVTGALALVVANGLVGQKSFGGVDVRAAVFVFVAIALAGAILQAGVLHYRGAFNNPLMYAPLTMPALAVLMSAWVAAAPSSAALL
ncbi:MAG TPA: hypothetical protein VJZ91_15130, partial [Blastocatellia bacterium]|nr:hypothetical protein [Blastocatellia bacterium]